VHSRTDDENSFDLNKGNPPSWTLKIEGRLLDVSSAIKGMMTHGYTHSFS
jgi:hypothetical protein